jgi:hypothetical protein
MAGEISNVSRDVSGLASALGGDISGVYGAQSKNLADLLVQSGMASTSTFKLGSRLSPIQILKLFPMSYWFRR